MPAAPVLGSEGNINALRTLAPPPLRPRSQAVTPPARTPPAGAVGTEDSASLPDPHVLAGEIAEDLRSALEQVESILGDLQARAAIKG